MSPVPARLAIDPIATVRAHQAAIWRYLRFLGADAPTAEDLTQDTFLAVLRAPFEDCGAASTRRYLRTVARNLFLKQLQRDARQPLQIDVETLDAEWDRWCGGDDGGERTIDTLRSCVAQLDHRARLAVRLRYEEARSRSEMAERLAISADGVKTLLRRIRELLRQCLEKHLA